MKTLIAFIAVALAAAVFPFLGQNKGSAKGLSPEMRRQKAAKNARIELALTSLRRGDVSQMAEVRSVIAGLAAGDFRRPAFAKLLIARGEMRAAYELERTRVHFLETSVSDDAEMTFYASLAERLGHPEEAAWARERTGEAGHFHIWKMREERRFVHQRSLWPRFRNSYEGDVDREMDSGIKLFPQFHDEIEALRTKLLSAP